MLILFCRSDQTGFAANGEGSKKRHISFGENAFSSAFNALSSGQEYVFFLNFVNVHTACIDMNTMKPQFQRWQSNVNLKQRLYRYVFTCLVMLSVVRNKGYRVQERLFLKELILQSLCNTSGLLISTNTSLSNFEQRLYI